MPLRSLVKAFALGLVHQPLLLIYQMGKVGSQTIEATLRNALPDQLIYRPHYLSRQQVAVVTGRLAFQSMPEATKQSVRSQIDMANLLRHAVLARRRLRRLGIKCAKLRVIAGVREPIGLALAALFQNHTTFFDSLADIDAGACANLLLGRDADPERAAFIAQFQSMVQNWFDVELKPIIGVDVYAKPFPRERGYGIYENSLARVLVYRFENLASLGHMLEEFLELKAPAILNQNVSSTKPYASRYEEVRRHLTLPAAFVEQQYSTKLAAHFYSKEEREQFAARWQGKTHSPPRVALHG